jgi:pimeloyl-ACP methyl ester carboxylesterase
VTANDAARAAALGLALLALAFSGRCRGGEAEGFPGPAGEGEMARVFRTTDSGCVLAVFSASPLADGVPPEGLRLAAIRALGRSPGSAAFFYWSRQDLAERWIRGQLEARRRRGFPLRLILAGHSQGGATAADMAKTLLDRESDAEIALLLTIDAVKTGRIETAAGAAGAAIANRIPGLNVNFTAYDAAPVPDGRRFWSHVNYYQDKSRFSRGAPMPGAENHRLEDRGGLLNHGNADDFALPFLTADLRAAIGGVAP